MPLILGLNMMDVAKKCDIKIDTAALAEELGCPVIAMSASSGQGISRLKSCIDARVVDPAVPTASVVYAPEIEEAIATLIPLLKKQSKPGSSTLERA